MSSRPDATIADEGPRAGSADVGVAPTTEGGRTVEARSIHFVGRVLRALVPATTLVALLFYFGYAYSQRLYRRFGVDVDGLEFSTPEYLIRSAEVVVDPLRIVAVTLALAVAAHAGTMFVLRSQGATGRRAVVVLAWSLVVVGATALLTFLDPSVTGVSDVAAALGWLLGAGGVSYGGYLLWATPSTSGTGRRLGDALGDTERSVMVGLVLVAAVTLVLYGTFELTRTYAIRRGDEIAEWVEEHCDIYPLVRIYSTVDLRLEWPDVEHEQFGEDDGGFRHRYRRLRQFNHDNGTYLLWPSSASPLDGMFALAADDRLRVEPDPAERADTACPDAGR